MADVEHGVFQGLLIQSLLIEHHIRLDRAAARITKRYFSRVIPHVFCVKSLATLSAIIPVHTPVQFQHTLTSCQLVQTVNILRHDGFYLSSRLKLRQLFVRDVRLCGKAEHFIPVKTVKLLRVSYIEGMA